MNTYLLFGLLASLAVQAAPAKRRCERRPAAPASSGVDDAGNDFAIQTTDVAGASSTSLSAVGAWAQGPHSRSRGDWRTRTARPPTSTAASASTGPSEVSSTSTASAASDTGAADPSMGPDPSTTPSASDLQAAGPSDIAATAPPVGDSTTASAATTTLEADNNVAVPTATSQTTSSAASSAESAPAPAPTSGGGGAASKRAGLAINEDSVKAFSGFLGGGVGWYTGWSMTPLPGTEGLEWVPQVWGTGNVAQVQASAAAWPAGVTHVVSFNEPDMTSAVGGSDIAPDVAAQKHIEWVNNLGGDYKIGAPAVARGSTKWMDDWIAACDGKCKYDFVPFHFYGTDANDLIAYAKDFHARYNKPLWLTETACTDYSTNTICDEAQVKTFMQTAVDWFEGEGASVVERWAWFGAFPEQAAGGNTNGLQNTDGTPNAMGEFYLSL